MSTSLPVHVHTRTCLPSVSITTAPSSAVLKTLAPQKQTRLAGGISPTAMDQYHRLVLELIQLLQPLFELVSWNML